METRIPTTMNPDAIGKRLRELRNATGKSAETVAAEINKTGNVHIGAAAISAYERGNRIPRDELKIALAHYFGVGVDELFFASN